MRPIAILRTRARAAVSRLRAEARAKGLDRLTPARIDALIAEVRGKRRLPPPKE